MPESVNTFLSFGLPSLSKPDVPVSQLLEEFSDVTPSVEDVLGSTFEYLLPHLFGLICLLIAIRSLDFRLKVQSNLGKSIPVFFAVILSVMGVGTLVDLPGSFTSDDFIGYLIVFAVEMLLLLILIRCFRSKSAGSLCARWTLALFYFFYFLWFSSFIFQAPLYGNWVSLAGTVLILLASFAEAHVRTGAGLLTCLWRVSSARVKFVDLEGSQCFECGYLLIGLRSRRCPECGLEFDRAEHGLDTDMRTDHGGG